ncbi:MAG: hypothetical protein HRU32_05105 [Rhodobacteraceae bacterium]|nr:hypothetical protein [Paracoccaceae bacterium]
MDRIKTAFLTALAVVAGLFSLGVFATIGLAVVGFLAVFGSVAALFAWIASRKVEQPSQTVET